MSFVSDENHSPFHIQPLLLTEPHGWAKFGLAPFDTAPSCMPWQHRVRLAANLWAPDPAEEEEVMLA